MAGVTLQTPQKVRRHGSKRKRPFSDEGDQDSLTAKNITSEPQRRPGADEDIDESIGHMNPGFLSDHVAKKIRRSFRDLSSVELEDRHLSQNIFYDTSDFELPRNLDSLPSFLEHFSDSGEEFSSSSEHPSSPHTLVIAASGLRAADMTRCLRKFQSQDSAVAKLFAKHIKLHEAIDYVRRTKIGIGIGTPQRLVDLLEKGVMKTKKMKRIVIDGSHLDQKKRSIFDMKELLDPLIKLFSVRPIKDRLDGDEKRIKVLVF